MSSSTRSIFAGRSAVGAEVSLWMVPGVAAGEQAAAFCPLGTGVDEFGPADRKALPNVQKVAGR